MNIWCPNCNKYAIYCNCRRHRHLIGFPLKGRWSIHRLAQGDPPSWGVWYKWKTFYVRYSSLPCRLFLPSIVSLEWKSNWNFLLLKHHPMNAINFPFQSVGGWKSRSQGLSPGLLSSSVLCNCHGMIHENVHGVAKFLCDNARAHAVIN